MSTKKRKKIKEDQEEREKKAMIYKERLAKGEQERLVQLAKVRKLKEEEKKKTAAKVYFKHRAICYILTLKSLS